MERLKVEVKEIMRELKEGLKGLVEGFERLEMLMHGKRDECEGREKGERRDKRRDHETRDVAAHTLQTASGRVEDEGPNITNRETSTAWKEFIHSLKNNNLASHQESTMPPEDEDKDLTPAFCWTEISLPVGSVPDGGDEGLKQIEGVKEGEWKRMKEKGDIFMEGKGEGIGKARGSGEEKGDGL